MHILSASKVLPFHSIGGMQAIAWDVLTEFVRLGHQVTVLTTKVPGRQSRWVEDGVTVIALQDTIPGRYSRRFWRASGAYLAALQDPVDAIFGISAGATGLLPFRRAAGIPYVCQLHGSSWGEAISKWRSGNFLEWIKSAKNIYWLVKDAELYRKYDALVLVGDVLFRQFEQFPLKSMTRTLEKVVIPNGIDTARFYPDSTAGDLVRANLGWSRTEKVLLFAARLHPQKGCDVAIRTLAQIRTRRPDFKLAIVGGGPEEKSLRQLANSLGCHDQIRFLGPQPRELMPSFLNAADVFLFPSLRKEGLPMNVLEALSSGTPVVCSDGLREVFSSDLPIAYSNPCDLEALSKLVVKVAENSRGTPRQSNLTSRFALRHCALSYLALFDRLISVRMGEMPSPTNA